MSDTILEMSDAAFEETVVANSGSCLVDFWAPWCPPCKIMLPIVEDLAAEYKDVLQFAKINVDDHQGTAAQFGVNNIPTILIFRDGELKERITGTMPKQELKKAIDTVIA